MDYWQHKLLRKLAQEYEEWVTRFEPVFYDEDESFMEACGKVSDPDQVWTDSDEPDTNEENGVSYAGSGYLCNGEEETGYGGAITKVPGSGYIFIYNEVRIFCELCLQRIELKNPCPFCGGDDSVWFFLNEVNQVINRDALNPALSLVEFEMLSTDSSVESRSYLSINEAIPLRVQKTLSKDVREVRFYLASNPHLSEEVMLSIAEDEDLAVRCKLARNSGITENVYNKLSEDAFASALLYFLHENQVTTKWQKH